MQARQPYTTDVVNNINVVKYKTRTNSKKWESFQEVKIETL